MVEAVIDSGAEESVAPPGLFPGRVVPSAMSRAGGKYRAANDARIPNLGQLRVSFATREGHRCGLPFQIAAVERPLIAVSQLAAAGNTVTLLKDHGTVRHDATGRELRLQRKGGVYTLLMHLPAAQGAEQRTTPAGFTRPGK